MSDEAIFNIWKKQNLDKYPHPKETIDVNYDEIITQDLPKTKEVNVLENLQKLKPETIDELREEWAMMTNAERGGYAKDELEKAMREKAAVFENDLALKSIITQDLNAQNAVSYGVDKDKLKNLGIMSQKQQGKSMDLSEFLDENGAVDYGKMGTIDTLLQMQKIKNFVDDFVNDKNARDIKTNKITFQTPAGDIKIYLPYAYGHFYKNGKFGNKKENRNNLTGALKSILKNPLFVAKDKQGALYFYKPFKDKSGIVDMISVSVDTNGKIQYKTSYADKYNQILSLMKNFEIVYKKGS